MRSRQVLSFPALIWFAVFVLLPLLIVFAVSFASRGTYGGLEWTATFDNYIRAFSWTSFAIFIESFKLALLTSVTCAVVGVLMAWAMSTAAVKERHFYVAALALPFLTNMVIRIYALRLFVGFDGPLQAVLKFLNIEFDPFILSQNQFLVFYGMVTTYLPFMVLPLFGAFEKFDFALVEAAQDLGASSWTILRTVILPNLKKPLTSGFLLVWIPSLGEFLIPDLLGGAKTMLYGNLITEQFLKARNWAQGSALAILLIVILLAIVFTVSRKKGTDYGS